MRCVGYSTNIDNQTQVYVVKSKRLPEAHVTHARWLVS